MTVSAKIIAHSIARGVELFSLELVYPRIIHSELMTHRVFGRSAESSRAVPVEKRIRMALEEPYVPDAFAVNKRGMQAGELLSDGEQVRSQTDWLAARDSAVQWAHTFAERGVHKQWANRLLEPFSHIRVIVTATEWENFFGLRISPLAMPEFRQLAEAIRDVMKESSPTERVAGSWHLPYVYADDRNQFADGRLLVKLSCARAARVSYLGHDGKRAPENDLRLYNELCTNMHMGALEHACQVEPEARPLRVLDYDYTDPMGEGREWRPRFIGNLRAPWVSHRKQIPGEDVFRGGVA